MWLFQIYISRNLTPEQAHEKLATIKLAIDPRGDHMLSPEDCAKRAELRQYVGDGVVKIPGVTPHEDPFPEWLHKIIKNKRGPKAKLARMLHGVPLGPPYRLEFDEKDWTYEVKLKTRFEIDEMVEWIKIVRGWATRKKGEIARFMHENVASMIFEDYEDIPSLSRVADDPDIGRTKF